MIFQIIRWATVLVVPGALAVGTTWVLFQRIRKPKDPKAIP
jgi:hypothetical protein